MTSHLIFVLDADVEIQENTESEILEFHLAFEMFCFGGWWFGFWWLGVWVLVVVGLGFGGWGFGFWWLVSGCA